MSKIWIKSPSPDGDCCDCSNQTGPCDSCGCFLTLPSYLINVSTSPLSSLAAAQNLLDNNTVNCLVQSRLSDDDSRIVTRSFNASFTNNIFNFLDVLRLRTAPGWDNAYLIRCYLKSSNTILAGYTSASSDVDTSNPYNIFTTRIYKDDGTTLVDSYNNKFPSSLDFTLSVPEDGYYYIYASFSNQNASLSANDVDLFLRVVLNLGTGGKVCSIRVAYDNTFLICV